MNATSSRAHTVLTISFTQIFHEEGTGKPLTRKQSDINLVDLAGSERASKTGATGDRLQEGSSINQSLSCLGKVITALAKKSAGGAARGEVIPYRESKLTRILQNALGGNSKTTMIAAISPATFNFEETLSTLRYADQVKSIKNKAVVNETPQEKLIRELKEENEKLKALLEGRGGSVGGGAGGGMSDEQRMEFEAQIEQLRREKEEAEKTAYQRAQEESTRIERQPTVHKKEITGPHITNLNEDPQLSGQIQHEFMEGQSRLGRSQENTIVLNGLGIAPEHCAVQRSGARHVLIPSSDAKNKTMVNGQILSSPYELNHLDRIKFGNYLFFLFIDPSQPPNPELNWEYAIKEANEAEMQALVTEQEKQMRRKQEEMEQKLKAEWEAKQRDMEEERRKLEAMLNQKSKQDEETRALLEEKERALLEKQREMEEELRKREQDLRDKEKERQQRARMDTMISNALQMSNEVNERAAMLGKPLRVKPEFSRTPGRDGTIGKGMENVSVRMRVMTPGLGDIRLYWPVEKLEERLPDMADMCQQYFEGTPLENIEMNYDPFWVEPEEVPSMMDEGGYIGQVNLITETLFYLFDIAEDSHPIYTPYGQQIGNLVAGIAPSLADEDIEEAGYENMHEIEGRTLDLTMSIKRIVDLPNEFAQDVYCSYMIPQAGRDTFTTQKVSGSNPGFDYIKKHQVLVTKYTVGEFEKGTITINIFGGKPQNLKNHEIETARRIFSAGTGVGKSGKRFQEETKSPLTSIRELEEPRAPARNPEKIVQPAKKSEEVKVPAKKAADSQPAQKTALVTPDKNSSDFDFRSHPSSEALIGSAKIKPATPLESTPGSVAVIQEARIVDERDEKIKKMEEELKKAKENQKAEKSSCCEII
mmetsp:Transcript_18369/g.18344  ORF Transcript_18369/g.18344 Transcript_18369/m.18344 type:complete len:877 (+) Transcript_18369:699-3329(+)